MIDRLEPLPTIRALSLVILSVIICTLSLLLHSSQHFRVECCIGSRKKQCLIGRNKNLALFLPITHLISNSYIIILLIFIIYKYISSPSFIIDWFIIHSLIITSICESFFNFYRFYSTYYASKKLKQLGAIKIFLKFIIFCIPYLIIFIFQIHFYYYLYPLIIFTHFIFNSTMVWLFGHILIVQYKFVMQSTESYLNDIHDHMLSDVYFMRRVSFISCTCSSIYMLLFILYNIDNINIILSIQILWNISCICLALNFVKNRQFIHSNWLKFKLYYYRLPCTRITKSRVHVRVSTTKPKAKKNKNTPNINAGPKIVPQNSFEPNIIESPSIEQKIQQSEMEPNTNHDSEISDQRERNNTFVQYVKNKLNTPISSNVDTPNTVQRKKAMKLLGIKMKIDVNISPPTTTVPGLFNHLTGATPKAFPKFLPPKQQDIEDQLAIEIISNQNDDELNDDEYANNNHMVTLENNSNTLPIIRVSNNLMLRRISTELNEVPIIKNKIKNIRKFKKKYKTSPNSNDKNQEDMNIPLTPNKGEIINVNEANIVCVNDEYDPPTPSPAKSITINIEQEFKHEKQNEINSKLSTENKKKTDFELERVRSQTEYIKKKRQSKMISKHISNTHSLGDGTMNIDVVEVFKVLASHGFYSNSNVKSAQQLRDYANNIMLK